MDDAVAFMYGEFCWRSDATEVDEGDATRGDFDDAIAGNAGAWVDANDALALAHE